MQATRPLFFAAAVLTLLISACSVPEDAASLPLEAQFGSAEDDMGIHVSYVSTGRIYSFAKELGYTYQQDTDGVYAYGKVILRRFDGSGNLTWSREIASRFCNGWGYDDCQTITPKSLEANSQGYVFALYTDHATDVQDCGDEDSYYISKVDSAGQASTIHLPSNGYGLGEGDAALSYTPSISMTVDGSGNIYVAQQKGDFDDEYCAAVRTNIVSKYSPSGSLLWQRTSTVGVPKDIVISSSGSIYVVGSAGFARYTNSGGLTWTKTGNFEEVVISGSNLYTRYRKDIRKYDSTGRQLWLKTQSGLNTLVLQAMDGDGSGNVYLSGKYKTSAGDSNAMARKLNSSGSVLWTKTYGTKSAYDDARGIATITGSEIYTTGETQGSLAHTNIGGRDGYLRKFSSGGGTVWTR